MLILDKKFNVDHIVRNIRLENINYSSEEEYNKYSTNYDVVMNFNGKLIAQFLSNYSGLEYCHDSYQSRILIPGVRMDPYGFETALLRADYIKLKNCDLPDIGLLSRKKLLKLIKEGKLFILRRHLMDFHIDYNDWDLSEFYKEFPYLKQIKLFYDEILFEESKIDDGGKTKQLIL